MAPSDAVELALERSPFPKYSRPLKRAVEIGIVGDLNPEYPTHLATNAALEHAGAALGVEVHATWLPTPSLRDADPEATLAELHGLFISPGSPYRDMAGALRAIEFARTREQPLLGTCGGFQHALIEFARNVMGIADADSAEHDVLSSNFVIAPIACAVSPGAPGAPKLSGPGHRVRFKEGSRLSAIYASSDALEAYFCSFEVNSAYVSRFQAAGMRFSALGDSDEVRALELPEHPFFTATLFQPQLASREGHPHPLIVAYVQAAAG